MSSAGLGFATATRTVGAGGGRRNGVRGGGGCRRGGRRSAGRQPHVQAPADASTTLALCYRFAGAALRPGVTVVPLRVAPNTSSASTATLRVDGAGSTRRRQGDRAKWVNDGDTDDADAAGGMISRCRRRRRLRDLHVLAAAPSQRLTTASAPRLATDARGDGGGGAPLRRRRGRRRRHRVPAGVGIRDGDIVSWVPRNTACTGGLPENTAFVARRGGRLHPRSGGGRQQLCYKFGGAAAPTYEKEHDPNAECPARRRAARGLSGALWSLVGAPATQSLRRDGRVRRRSCGVGARRRRLRRAGGWDAAHAQVLMPLGRLGRPPCSNAGASRPRRNDAVLLLLPGARAPPAMPWAGHLVEYVAVAAGITAPTESFAIAGRGTLRLRARASATATSRAGYWTPRATGGGCDGGRARRRRRVRLQQHGRRDGRRAAPAQGEFGHTDGERRRRRRSPALPSRCARSRPCCSRPNTWRWCSWRGGHNDADRVTWAPAGADCEENRRSKAARCGDQRLCGGHVRRRAPLSSAIRSASGPSSLSPRSPPPSPSPPWQPSRIRRSPPDLLGAVVGVNTSFVLQGSIASCIWCLHLSTRRAALST